MFFYKEQFSFKQSETRSMASSVETMNTTESNFSGTQLGVGGGDNADDTYNNNNAAVLKKPIPYEERRLSQLTIKQITDAAVKQNGNDALIVDKVEVSQIHMIVRLLSIEVTNAFILYRINDYSGTLDAKQWDTQQQQNDKATLRYVTNRLSVWRN
jgi:hypothetical protein